MLMHQSRRVVVYVVLLLLPLTALWSSGLLSSSPTPLHFTQAYTEDIPHTSTAQDKDKSGEDTREPPEVVQENQEILFQLIHDKDTTQSAPRTPTEEHSPSTTQASATTPLSTVPATTSVGVSSQRATVTTPHHSQDDGTLVPLTTLEPGQTPEAGDDPVDVALEAVIEAVLESTQEEYDGRYEEPSEVLMQDIVKNQDIEDNMDLFKLVSNH